MQEHKTILWWRMLSSLAGINICLWVWVALTVEVQSVYVFWQLVLSGVFTGVCAFRSFFPRIDLERYCLVDSFISSMVVGRSAATVAEISFASQIALLMYEVGASTGVFWVQNQAI